MKSLYLTLGSTMWSVRRDVKARTQDPHYDVKFASFISMESDYDKAKTQCGNLFYHVPSSTVIWC
jgi:hypothetical protein